MQETGASFRSRWAAVNAIQNAELRRLSTSERFAQLEELFAFQRLLGNDERDPEELAAVRKRWATLRRRLRAKG